MGIGAGIISAVKRYSFWDILVTLTTSVLVAVPAFWLGMLLQLFFGVLIKDWTGGAFSLPISGAGGPSSQYQDWIHYILPAITQMCIRDRNKKAKALVAAGIVPVFCCGEPLEVREAGTYVDVYKRQTFGSFPTRSTIRRCAP